MSQWKYKSGRAVVTVDKALFADAMRPTFPELNSLAEDIASTARSFLPDPAMKRFIGVKHAGVVQPQNIGLWVMKMGRKRGSLMRDMELPVALVTSDSQMSFYWEYGTGLAEAEEAVAEASKKAGVRGFPSMQAQPPAQYSPLLKALALTGSGHAKYRKPRR